MLMWGKKDRLREVGKGCKGKDREGLGRGQGAQQVVCCAAGAPNATGQGHRMHVASDAAPLYQGPWAYNCLVFNTNKLLTRS